MRDSTEDGRSVYQALNDIADHWSAEREFPADTTLEDVTALYELLYIAVLPRIETFESQSGLSRIEAEVWVLQKTSDQRGNQLTDEAIAHVLCMDESPFGEGKEDRVDETVLPATADAVQYLSFEIDRKYRAAEGLVKETVTTAHETKLENSRLVCLEWATVNDIRNRREAGDTTLDDTVKRLLAESAQSQTLEEFTQEYLTARGRDSIAQLVLHRPEDESGTIILTAHTDSTDDVPDVVRNTDVLEVDGERYDFMFDEDPYGPAHGQYRVTLFSSREIEGQEPVPLADGIEAARDVFEEGRYLPKSQPSA